jgi:membrane associated rhomboid family serine protease
MQLPQGGVVPQLTNPFVDIPRLSKILAGFILSFYLLGVILGEENGVKFLALIPGYTISDIYVWNIFTAGFFDKYLLSSLFDSAILVIFGKYLEPIWGSKEFLKFILIINLLIGFSTFVVVIILYIIFRNEQLLFAEIYGFSGILASFSVAMKQLMPENQLPMLCGLRIKHLPALSLVFSLFLLTKPLLILFVLFGIIYGWIYLRFFQSKGSNIIGDMSDQFSFASFFPEPIQPVISSFSNFVFNLLQKCGCCKNFNVTTATSQTGYSIINTSLPGNDPAEAERRRNRALKVLGERLSKQTPATQDNPNNATDSSDKV